MKSKFFTAFTAALCIALPAGADPSADCLTARDRACLADRIAPEMAAWLEVEPSLHSGHPALTFAVEHKQHDALGPMLDALRPRAAAGQDTDFAAELIGAYAHLKDPEGLVTYAEGLPGARASLRPAMANLHYYRVRDGEVDRLAALDQDAPMREDTAFILIETAAQQGRWDAALDWSRLASVDAKLAASQRVAWYAVQSGDADAMARAVEGLLSFTRAETAPQRHRPGLLAHIAAWLELQTTGDPDALVGTLEEGSLPEVSDDPTLIAFQQIVAAMLLTRMGDTAQADGLAEAALAALESEIRDWDAELDGELIALAVAAHELGQPDLRDRIFALRVIGPFSPYNFFLSWLEGDTLAHFVPLFDSQFLQMAEDTMAGRSRPDYFEYSVEEGFLGDVGPICEGYLRLDQPGEAARLYADTMALLARVPGSAYAGQDVNGAVTRAYLYRDCHQPDHDPAAFEAMILASESDHAVFEYLVDTAQWSRIVPALRAQGYVRTEHMLGLLEGVSGGPDFDMMLGEVFSLIADGAAEKRARYPDQADEDLALLVQYAMLFKQGDAAGYFARIEAPDMRVRALVGAMWALDEGPPEPWVEHDDGHVWFDSRVNMRPGL